MSNSIEQGLSAALAVMDKLESKADAIDLKFIEIAKNARGIAPVDVDAIGSKELGERLEKNNSFIAQMNAKLQEQQKINKALEAQIKRLQNVRAQSNKKTAEEIANTRILRKNADLYARSTANLATEYEKLSSKLTILKREYKNLAVQEAQGIALDEKQIETKERLFAEITKVDGVLKQTDQTVGESFRNVGNYKSAFDGLGFSITQLAREAPAFANSVQTGFMAISNNLPMLFDEIQKLRVANKALAAEGKATQGVLGKIGKSLLSAQVLLSVGVTLLTIYGKDLIDLAFGASEAEKAQTRLNKSISEAQASVFASTKELKTYRDIVVDSTKSDVARQEALDNLAQTIPELTGATIDQEGSMQKVVDITEKYIQATAARAKADAFSKIIAEREAKLFERKAANLEEEVKWYDYVVAAAKGYGTAGLDAASIVTAAQDRRKEGVEEETKVIEQLNEKFEEQLLAALELEAGLQGLNKGTGEFVGTLKKVDTLLGDAGLSFDELRQKLFELWIKGIIDGETYRKKVADIDQAHQDLIDTLRLTSEQDVFDGLIVPSDVEIVEALTLKLDELKGKMQEIGTTDMGWEAQLTTATSFFSDIGNLASTLYERNIQRIDDEIARNEQKYSEILASEEFSLEQRARLEAQQEQKRVELERKKRQEQIKQARIEKAFNAARVIANTAVGISKALAQGGAIFSIPFSAIVAAQGAIQLAAVLAQPIPKFKDGHLSGTYEGAALINDAKSSNYREILERADGRLEMYSNRNQLVQMNKGDKVHPAHNVESMLYDRLLKDTGILPPKQETRDVSKDIEKGMSRAINKMPSSSGNYQDIAKVIAKELYLQKQINKA